MENILEKIRKKLNQLENVDSISISKVNFIDELNFVDFGKFESCIGKTIKAPVDTNGKDITLYGHELRIHENFVKGEFEILVKPRHRPQEIKNSQTY